MNERQITNAISRLLGEVVCTSEYASYCNGTEGGAWYVLVAHDSKRVHELMDLSAKWALEDGIVPTLAKYRPTVVDKACCFVAEVTGERCAGSAEFGGFCSTHDTLIHDAGGDSSEGGRAIIRRSTLREPTDGR